MEITIMLTDALDLEAASLSPSTHEKFLQIWPQRLSSISSGLNSINMVYGLQIPVLVVAEFSFS